MKPKVKVLLFGILILSIVTLAIIPIISGCGNNEPKEESITIPQLELTEYTAGQLEILINQTYKRMGNEALKGQATNYYELLIIIYQNELARR